ncbi:MAG: ABC transporter permease [Acidimicrobiia bacterium]|nr:ABC transporter permease [Acidimicrobiia bacterium]
MLGRVVERELSVYRRTWQGSIFTSFAAPALFLAAIGLGLGGLVDEGTGDVAGTSYLVFVAPGLLAAMVMQTASTDSLWPVMAGTRWLRFFHGMVASPLSPADVYGGYVLWVGLRSCLSSSVFLVVAAVLGALGSPTAVFAVPAAALGAISFAAPICAYSVTRETDASFSVLFRLLIQPLFLFSGTFFPVSQLPDGIEPLVWLSPLYHAVELCRAATTGRGDPFLLVVHVLVLVGVVVASAAIGTRAFAKRLTP